MTRDQLVTWCVLKGDFSCLVDHMPLKDLVDLVGHAGQGLQEDQVNKICGDVLWCVMDLPRPVTEVSAMLYLWLNRWQLPLDADQHPAWNRFHQQHGAWVLDNSKHLSQLAVDLAW